MLSGELDFAGGYFGEREASGVGAAVSAGTGAAAGRAKARLHLSEQMRTLRYIECSARCQPRGL